jgi:phage gp45-like
MFDAHFTRFAFDGRVDHRDGQQFVDGKGFAGDVFRRVHRPEPHGFASHPVKGGIGALLQSRGNRDSAYIFGGENPQLRPSGDMLTAGGTAIYDAAGNIVSVVAAKLRIVHSAAVHIVAPEIILEGTVKLGGPGASRPVSAQGTIDSGGFADTSNFAASVLAT